MGNMTNLIKHQNARVLINQEHTDHATEELRTNFP